MDTLVTPYAPSPGVAKPGNLYADLQTRTLWLGVDPAVDPAEAVLISDIVTLQGEIDDALVEAKAYTDTQITTRAPTVHTHTSSQITDFTAAVTAVASAIPGLQYVRGMIMIWSGSLAEIGVGPLAGWSLCDGSNGTPDLRDKFVIGAGNKLPGSANPLTGLTTPDAGSHQHVNNGTAISIAQMPSHGHGGATGYVSHDHSHSVNINTGTESHDHQHGVNDGAGAHVSISGSGAYGAGASTQLLSSGRTQAHWHNVSGGTSGMSQNHYHGMNYEGGSQAHTHTMQFAGIHNHVIPANTLRDSIPYFAYAFIMKL